jgi:hypothetical protein
MKLVSDKIAGECWSQKPASNEVAIQRDRGVSDVSAAPPRKIRLAQSYAEVRKVLGSKRDRPRSEYEMNK